MQWISYIQWPAMFVTVLARTCVAADMPCSNEYSWREKNRRSGKRGRPGRPPSLISELLFKPLWAATAILACAQPAVRLAVASPFWTFWPLQTCRQVVLPP
jgi:hypothetical protein